MREIHDHYFREAKREGYLSRAAYKLIEIDDRKKVLRRGDLVLDCGAAPGSWLQVAARRVGERGCVVGVDLQPIHHRFAESNIHIVQGDLSEIEPNALLRHMTRDRFDVILSDMAPGTTGDARRDHYRSADLCRVVLDRCGDLLRPGGNLVMKVFEGERYPDLLAAAKTIFDRAKGFKPKASRRESVEIFIIAHGYRGSPAADRPTSAVASPLPPRPDPSQGWAR